MPGASRPGIEENKAAMLGAMGYRVDDEAALSEQLEQEHRQHWLRATGSRDGGPQRRRRYLEVRLPSNSSTMPSPGSSSRSRVQCCPVNSPHRG